MAKKTVVESREQPAAEFPVRFSELLGHGAQVRFLTRAIARGVLPQTILFTGPEGVGKATLARMAAAALECEDPTSGACGSCGACRKAARAIHPDLRVVKPEGLTESGKERAQIRIEQVREGILAPLALPPYEGKRLVFLIDPAEALNENAQNSLLKSLEEPPPYVQFFLVSANPAGLLPTVRSRCHEIPLGPVDEDSMRKAAARAGIPEGERGLALGSAAGAPGRLLAFDRRGSELRRGTLLALLGDGLDLAASPGLIPAVEKLAKENPREVVSLATGLLRDALRAGRGAAPRLHGDVTETLREAAANRGPENLQRMADRLADAPAQLARNVNPRLLLEWVFLVP
jgi:DNA polymerase-3 subunit delta'